jgi:RNA polymerase sigma-70 factor, ECF subfamily
MLERPHNAQTMAQLTLQSGGGTQDDDVALLGALRRRDEAAFCELLDRYGAAMLNFALTHTRDRGVAEDAVQDTWLAVFRGIAAFEGRCSLRTWLFRILLNRLRTRVEREHRMVAFSELADTGEPAMDPECFLGPDHPRWPWHWKVPPKDWGPSPEDALLTHEVRARVADAIEQLPVQQRQVITLRDVDGWTANEVCELLQLSEANQRVLLHRARARVRRSLASYFEEG